MQYGLIGNFVIQNPVDVLGLRFSSYNCVTFAKYSFQHFTGSKTKVIRIKKLLVHEKLQLKKKTELTSISLDPSGQLFLL